MREPYVPLFRSILDSSIWFHDADTRLVWIALMAMADSDGYVASSLPGIAARARVSLDAARKAVGILESPDTESRNEENEGRRIERVKRGWRVLNVKVFRDLARHESEKARKRRWWRENRGLDAKLDNSPLGLDPQKQTQKQKQTSYVGSAGGDGAIDSDRETLCPMNLVETFAGFDELSRKLNEPVERLQRRAEAFVTYWTIGKGIGTKKAHWSRWLRQRLIDEVTGRAPDSLTQSGHRPQRTGVVRPEDLKDL